MTGSALFLSANEVADLFDPETAIESQRVAFTALGRGTAVLPDKLMVSNAADGSVAFCYAARLSDRDGAVCKFGSVNPANAAEGMPSIAALVVALDARTGQPAAIMDGTVITTRRTAAASAVAVDVLSAPDVTEVAVLGCGVQGREHVRMLVRVRDLQTVRLWAPTRSTVENAVAELAEETGVSLLACETPEAAVRGADVVVTSTLSSVPVLELAWLASNATVVSVGSIEPTRCEVGQDIVGAARVVVDDPATAASHAGPVVEALRRGVLYESDLVSLGDVLVGAEPGRTRKDELVYYNSVGVGVQDAAAVAAVTARASEARVGQQLVLTRSV